jgi:hypothetical protein
VIVYGDTQYGAYITEFRGGEKIGTSVNLVAGTSSTILIRESFHLTVTFVERTCPSFFSGDDEPNMEC